MSAKTMNAKGLGFLVAVVATSLTGGMARAQEEGKQHDNPQFAAWSGFKVGSYVKQQTISQGEGFKSEMIITQKLVEVGKDKLVLEMSQTMITNGEKMEMPANRMDIPATFTVPAGVPTEEGEKVESKSTDGSESLSVGTQKLDCKWTETTVKAGDQTYVTKMWMCDEVPGKSVKLTSSAAGTEMTTTTLEFKAVK